MLMPDSKTVKLHLTIVAILLSIFLYQVAFAAHNNLNKPWSTREHLNTGNKLHLYFCKSNYMNCTTDNLDVKSVPDVLLDFDNGLQLTFAEIITVSGDYFAIGDQPITGDLYDNYFDIQENAYDKSSVILSKEQLKKLELRFINAFNTLAQDWYAERKVDLVFKYLSGDLSLEEAIRLGLERYDLAVKNYDHFAPYSWHAYSVGHYIAINIAAEAGQSQDQNKLKDAYAVEAFAQHFLTDAFSAGHFRVPLKQLQRFALFQKNALLLTKFMHDEDSKFGLNVHNKHGDHWRAYGDDYYNDERNIQNTRQLQNIQQLGIAQLFYIYLNPAEIEYEELFSELSEYLPILNTESNINLALAPQNSPLFFSDEYDTIYRRYDINLLQDRETTLLSQFGAMTLLIEKLFSYDPH